MKKISILTLALLSILGLQAQHFSISPDNGCGEVEVSLTNLHPSEDYTPEMFITTGFSYEWDFGDGNTSTDENPDPVLFNTLGSHDIEYTVTIDTIGFELSKIVLDGYLGCDDTFGGDVDVYIILTDNNSVELVNTEDDAGSYEVDPTENNHLEFVLGSMNVGSDVPLWLKIMDSDSMDADDNCIDDGEGDGTMIAIPLPPNNEDGFFETTKVITASTPNGDLTITAYFNKPVLILNQTITVDVYPLPASPSIDATDLNACVGDAMPTISATGTDIQWYDDEELTNMIYAGADFTPTLTTEDSVYTFYATQTESINSCESEATVVTVDYGNLAVPTFQSYSSSYCYGQIMPNFIGNGDNLIWYDDEELTSMINEGDTLEISDLEVGEHSFYCIQSNEAQTCTSDAAELNFTIIDAIQATVSETDVSCFGLSDGEASVEVTAGSEPFAYTWSNGGTTETASGLPAGDYTVTIRDNNFCLLVLDALINEPEEIQINSNVVSGFCPDDEFGQITTNVTGGVSPYTYAWSDESTGESLDNAIEGTYTLTVSDDTGCTQTEESFIERSSAFAVISEIIKESCPGTYDGSISINVSGATEPYEYNWSSGSIDTITSQLSAGDYSVTITDFMGCNKSNSFTIDNQYTICLVPANVLTPNNDGINDTWQIKFIEMNPQANIKVFSRSGQLVFEATGYSNNWDGTYNNKPLPIGSYLYVIDTGFEEELQKGYVDIIR